MQPGIHRDFKEASFNDIKGSTSRMESLPRLLFDGSDLCPLRKKTSTRIATKVSKLQKKQTPLQLDLKSNPGGFKKLPVIILPSELRFLAPGKSTSSPGACLTERISMERRQCLQRRTTADFGGWLLAPHRSSPKSSQAIWILMDQFQHYQSPVDTIGYSDNLQIDLCFWAIPILVQLYSWDPSRLIFK